MLTGSFLRLPERLVWIIPAAGESSDDLSHISIDVALQSCIPQRSGLRGMKPHPPG
ncbi:MAG: hypothetical protein KAJ95_00855 [Gammaproteobacteria bacterium]|nr:hypothetical protein [Gammaproteobacteria bacterium]